MLRNVFSKWFLSCDYMVEGWLYRWVYLVKVEKGMSICKDFMLVGKNFGKMKESLWDCEIRIKRE